MRPNVILLFPLLVGVGCSPTATKQPQTVPPKEAAKETAVKPKDEVVIIKSSRSSNCQWDDTPDPSGYYESPDYSSPDCQPRLSPAEAKSEFERCRTEFALTNAGKVLLKLVVSPSGEVLREDVESEFENMAYEMCISGIGSRILFEKRAGKENTVIELPMVLAPRPQKPK